MDTLITYKLKDCEQYITVNMRHIVFVKEQADGDLFLKLSDGNAELVDIEAPVERCPGTWKKVN